MTKAELEKLKREVNLRDFARDRYGIESNEHGMAHCPFHPPDNRPSLQLWKGRTGYFRFTDQHTQKGGTIVDFVMAMEKLDSTEALKLLTDLYFKEQASKKRTTKEAVFYYYLDIEGHPVFRKGKRVYSDGDKKFWLERYEDGQWKKRQGGRDSVPYNLQERSGKVSAIVCEGEKDADTVNRVIKAAGLERWVTSPMYGKSSWPSCYLPYFDGLSEIVFIYDVGAENNAEEHARLLKESQPEAQVSVARVPLDLTNADITDYLDVLGGDEAIERKIGALLEVIARASVVEGVTSGRAADNEPVGPGEAANV